ncbi:hypothetical protein IG631_10468 [Alternaria alternata]|nr:hypothetical protein IG631_10468 [Alternaria alternata]
MQPTATGKNRLDACSLTALYKTAYSPSPRRPVDYRKQTAAQNSKALAPDSFVK